MNNNKQYTPIFRLMHWSIAICMLLILGTIFLRNTWMNKNNVAAIIEKYLVTTDQSLSQEQLITLAKQIRKPMWDWHVYLGYVLVGLYTIRMILPFFGHMKFSNPFAKGLGALWRLQYTIYLIFYLCVAVSLTTGLVIELGPKEYKKSMEDIHILSIYYLLTFIVIHFSGILIAEFTNKKGIISEVISGSKKVN